MQTYTNLVVERFVEYSSNFCGYTLCSWRLTNCYFIGELFNTLPNCKEILPVKRRVAVDLTIIIDGSRSEYENLQVIA